MKKQVLETFNELAVIYEQMGETDNLYNTQYERPAMMQQVPTDMAGMRVLDAGCSAGWYAKELADRGAQVTAVDMSPDMVSITKKLLGDKGEALCLDLEEPLPFGDNSFHFIVSSLTLHYLKDWQAAFAELSRVLKPNGVFLLSVHHPLTDLRLLNDSDYFSTELIVDQWNKGGKTYQVPFYRRPLSEVLNALTAEFSIEKVIEPKPTAVFKELAPEQYSRLLKSPNFLILKVQNPS